MILLISITIIQTEQSLLKPILFGRDYFMKTPHIQRTKPKMTILYYVLSNFVHEIVVLYQAWIQKLRI